MLRTQGGLRPLGVLRTRGRPAAGGGVGGGRRQGRRDKEWAGDCRNGVVTTNHPTTLRRGPPLLGKEGSANSGVGRRESGVGRKIRPIW